MRIPHLPGARPAAALLLVATLAGCGTDDAGPQRASAAQAEPATGATLAAPVPITTREGRVGDEPVTLELMPLRRNGRMVSMELRLRTRSEVELEVGEAFDDGLRDDSIDYEDAETLDGIAIVDGLNGRRFRPAEDAEGHCMCDRELTTEVVSRDRPLILSAAFPAPPANVRTVHVVIPRFGTIADVPLV